MANSYSYSWISYSKFLLLQRTLISISSGCTAQDTAAVNLLRCSSVCACALDICTFTAGKGALGAHCIPDDSCSVEAAFWDEESQMKNLGWRTHMISQAAPEAIAALAMWFQTQSSVGSSHIPLVNSCSSVHGVNSAITPFYRRFTFWKEESCLCLLRWISDFVYWAG